MKSRLEADFDSIDVATSSYLGTGLATDDRERIEKAEGILRCFPDVYESVKNDQQVARYFAGRKESVQRLIPAAVDAMNAVPEDDEVPLSVYSAIATEVFDLSELIGEERAWEMFLDAVDEEL